jgi:hypothetical protein
MMQLAPGTSTPSRPLHEQLRAEIALLQLELNHLATHNSELVRQVASSHARTTPLRMPHAAVVMVDASTDVEPHVSPQTSLRELDINSRTGLAPQRPWQSARSKEDFVLVLGASASRECPVGVAGYGDDDAGMGVISSLDMYGYDNTAWATSDSDDPHRVLLHRPPITVADAATDAPALSASALAAGRLHELSVALQAITEKMASTQHILLSDVEGGATVCDANPAPPPSIPDLGAVLSLEQEFVAVAACAHRQADFALDRATELRDAALARQMALTTYLDRCLRERQQAASDALNRIASERDLRLDAEERVAQVQADLDNAHAALTELETRNVELFREGKTLAASMSELQARCDDLERLRVSEAASFRRREAELEAALDRQGEALMRSTRDVDDLKAQLRLAVTAAGMLSVVAPSLSDAGSDASPVGNQSPGVASGASPSNHHRSGSVETAPMAIARTPSTGRHTSHYSPLKSPSPNDEDELEYSKQQLPEPTSRRVTWAESDSIVGSVVNPTTYPRSADLHGLRAIGALTKETLRRQRHLADGVEAQVLAPVVKP